MADISNVSWPGWETGPVIGRGSFGTVYEIRRDVYGEEEKAALKVISIPVDRSEVDELRSSGYDDDSIALHLKECVAGIVKEYQLMAHLRDNPNVVHCEDLKTIPSRDGTGWEIRIKMELLQPLMKQPGVAGNETQIIQLGLDLCGALTDCWEQKIIHRDIKPQNIFVSRSGRYKLGDFGIARTIEHSTTNATTKIGTLTFMAPEVYNNKSYGPSVDQYSLGLVMYWLLNDKRGPFLPNNGQVPSAEMLQAARNRRFSGEPLPPPIHGSEQLKRIVMKACAFDPADRYADPGQMLKDLQKLSAAGTKVEKKPENTEITEGPLDEIIGTTGTAINWKKLKWPVAAAVVVLLALIIGFFTIHIGTDVTCVSASVCKLCGKELAPAAGHVWSAANCTDAGYCRICGINGDQALGHDYLPATCEMPQTCSRCGAVVGEKLAHEVVEATCAQTQHCVLCGAVFSDALPHDWVEATFRAPRNCKTCGAVEGLALDYSVISVEDEISKIRSDYKEIVGGMQSTYRKAALRDGVDAYYDGNNQIRSIVVYRGTEGIGTYSSTYSRTYYFTDGKLIFAFFEGADGHRLYFYQQMLMRWRYRPAGEPSENAVNHDFEFTDEYILWETLALEEVRTFSRSGLPLGLCREVDNSNVTGSTTDVAFGTWTDCLGNAHASAVRFWVSAKAGWSSMEYATYRLDGAYDRLTGTISLGKESNSGATVWFRIYLDGVLAYESPMVGQNTEPVAFELDVSTVRDLRVECKTDLDAFGYGIMDAVLHQEE